MKLSLAFAAVSFAASTLCAQTTAPQPGDAQEQPAPYSGGFAHGLREIEALAGKGDTQAALAIADALLAPSRFARWHENTLAGSGWRSNLVRAADPLFDALGWNEPAAERAAVQYARGVVLSLAQRSQEAEQAFEFARSLAGPGPLRLDAIYDLGFLALERGEALRAQIPELNPAPGGPGSAQLATPPAAPAPGGGEPPDPIELARAAYLDAREHFVERLRSDFDDADTQANVELIQRRLAELKQLEKKREEQKKEQQQKKDKQDEQSKQDQDKSNENKDPDQQKDSKDQPPDEQKPKPEEPKDKQPEDAQDKKKEEQDQQAQKKDDPSKNEQQPEPKEELLTKEEMMRLLDLLKQREEQGQRLQQQLHHARRVKVKKDW